MPNESQKDQIKFKAWHKKEKRFYDVVGLEFEGWIGDMYSKTRRVNIKICDRPDRNGCKLEWCLLTELILFQWSTLKDSNKQDIYPGDILRGAVIGDDPIVFEAPGLHFFHFWQEMEDALAEGKEILVIGNVYKNPELLKKL